MFPLCRAPTSKTRLVRLGARMDMVQAVWNGVTIVVDEISQLDEGEIKLSGIMLRQPRSSEAAVSAKGRRSTHKPSFPR